MLNKHIKIIKKQIVYSAIIMYYINYYKIEIIYICIARTFDKKIIFSGAGIEPATVRYMSLTATV